MFFYQCWNLSHGMSYIRAGGQMDAGTSMYEIHSCCNCQKSANIYAEISEKCSMLSFVYPAISVTDGNIVWNFETQQRKAHFTWF